MADPPIPNTTIFFKFRVETGAGKKLVGIENSSPKRSASLIFCGNSPNNSIILF